MLERALLGGPDASEQPQFSSNLILLWSEPPVAAATVLLSPSQLPGLRKHWVHLKSSLLQQGEDIMVSRTQRGFLLWAHMAPSSLFLFTQHLPTTQAGRNPSPSLPTPVDFPGKQMSSLRAQGSGVGVIAPP